MVKSAIDATRFTSTTPHASAKTPTSSPNSSSIPNHAPGPLGETPHQKVRRLREAAARARDAKISTFDKIVIHGRVWADRAHRFTALTLIGLTGVAGVVTVYALGDMIVYNRRKRREYYAEQAAVQEAAIYEAQKAVRHGLANQEQVALVEQMETERRAYEEKNASKGLGIMARVKGLLYSGLDKEGVQGYEIRAKEGEVDVGAEDERPAESTILKALGGREAEIREPKEASRRGEMKNTLERATEREREAQSRGGLLDRLGTSAAPSVDEEVSKQGGGWLTFMSRR